MWHNVRVVLVETSHSGNLGSVARAMKTMGFSDLVLVNPQAPIDAQAIALAAGANEVIERARIVNSLDEAIADCQLVMATSARSRTLSWPQLSSREAGIQLAAQAQSAPVAIVFGRERSGLTNEELQQADVHIYIPGNPDYCSLNLAMAVQLVCYDIRMSLLDASEDSSTVSDQQYPEHQQLQQFYQHLEQVLHQVGFLQPNHPGKIMEKLRFLFARARPDARELSTLRGILAAVSKKVKPD